MIPCRGRLTETVLEYEAKHPILLPRDHHLTNHFIDQCYHRVPNHDVRETILSEQGKTSSEKDDQLQ